MLTEPELTALKELDWEIRAGPGNEETVTKLLRTLGCGSLADLALKLARETIEVADSKGILRHH